MPPRTRWTILPGVVSLALVVFTVVAFRAEIQKQYHLFRLRRDPTYLHEILKAPEGTPRRAAVRKYLESNEGKTALVRECMPVKIMTRMGIAPETAPWVSLHVGSDHLEVVANNTKIFSGEPEVIALAGEYLLNDSTFGHAEYPEMQIQVVKVWTTPSVPSPGKGRTSFEAWMRAAKK